MHVEFLVEERSAEAALQNLVPKIIGSEHTFRVHAHAGKRNLLSILPARLSAYRVWLPNDWRIVVLVDRDQDDCLKLKQSLEAIACQAGFLRRSSSTARQRLDLVNRLAIEELEAWFFGDVEALVAAYPRVSGNLGRQAGYRDPDAITDGTWERLERVLKRAGYYSAGLPKVETARNISTYMEPERNRSRSFQVFRDGLRELVG